MSIWEPKSPENLVDEGIQFVKDLLGKNTPLIISQEEYIPPVGSHAPSGMRVVTASKSPKDMESGNYFKFIMGFHGEKPFLYGSETYQSTTPGFLPVNANDALNYKYYQFDKTRNPSAVLNPLQHIFALVGGAIVGRPGGMNDMDEIDKTRYDKLWRISLSYGVEISDATGRPVRIGGIPLALRGAESSARERIEAMGAGPVIGLQNVPKGVHDIEGITMRAARADATAGKIPGLPRDIYALDTISETKRLTTAETIGVPMASGGYSSLTNTPTKAAQIGKRPYAPIRAVSKTRMFEPPEDPAWRQETAVFAEGDPRGKQLVVKGMIPTIGSGSISGEAISSVMLPSRFLNKIRGVENKAMLEATFRSTIDVPIELRRPEDLFYQTESGESKLRFQLANEFTPNKLERKNLIQAGSTVRIGDLVGMEKGNIDRKALLVSTNNRHVGVESVVATFPLEWTNSSASKKFVETTLIPALQAQGVTQFEYKATPENDGGVRAMSIGLNVLQAEPMSFKNYTKSTNMPLPRGMMGLWREGKSGNLELEASTEAVIPFKSAEGAIWSAFRIASGAQQKKMLQSLNLSMEQKKGLKTYYRGLEEGQPASINSIAQVLGYESGVHVLEAMRYSILGTKNIVKKIDKSGQIIVDQEVAAQQQKMFEKYGISRDYGFLPVGEFTEKTKNYFIEGAVRNLLKHTPYNITEQEARVLTDAAFTFLPGEKLRGGQQIYQGFALQEVIRAKEIAINPEIEWFGKARDSYDYIDHIMGAAGKGDIVEFRKRTKQESGATERALDELSKSFSNTLRGNSPPGAYIHIGDESTNIEGRRLSRTDFTSILATIQASEGGSAGALEKLNTEMRNMFGDGDFGFEFALGKKRAYLPSISAVQRIDADTLNIDPGEDSEIQDRSLARLPQRFIRTARGLAAGDDVSFESGVDMIRRVAKTYLRSDNLTKTPYGIHSKYEGNTLLEPGQVAILDPGLRSLYQISGGDIHDVKSLQSYFNTFIGGAVGIGTRQPRIGQIAGPHGTASTGLYQILTQGNSDVVAKIAKQAEAAGIRSQNIIMSPEQANIMGDFDADALEVYVAIGRATGEPGKFVNAIGGMTAEEKFQYTKQLLKEQGPEVQEKAMEYMMQGEDLALKKSPTMLNRMNYLWQLSGRAPDSSLWAKSPYHDVGPEFVDKTANASYQKNFAMGGTHNQLIRRLMSAGIALNLEPKTYYSAMTGIGTKYSQLAVDQEYAPQSLVNALQGAFLSQSEGGGLQVSINTSKAKFGDAKFVPVPWNEKNPFGNVVGAFGAVMMESDDLSARGMAQLFGQIKGARSARLSPDESISLADRQIRQWEDLIPEFESMKKMGLGDRIIRMNQLVAEGKIGEDSEFGVALKSRLGEHYEGHKTSTSLVRQNKAAKIEAGAAVSDIDLQNELFNTKISNATNIFQILKGTKNLNDLGNWQDPAAFAGMAYGFAKQGIQDNPLVQSIMQQWGPYHGLTFQNNPTGNGVQLVSTDTNKVINTNRDLVNYQNTIRSMNKQYEQYDAENDPRVQSSGQAQPASLMDDLTNLAIASGAMGTGAQSQTPTGASPSYSYGYGGSGGSGRGGRGSSRFSASKEVSSAMAAWNVRSFEQTLDEFLFTGQKANLEAFGTRPDQISLFGQTAGLTAYDRLREIQRYGSHEQQTRLPYYMRNNPKISRAISTLRSLKQNAYDVWEAYGISNEYGMLAGTMINAPGAEEALLGSEWGREMYDLLPFAETPFAKERRPDLAEDKALWLRANKEFLEKSIAEQEYIKYGGAERKYAVTSRERKQALTKEDAAMLNLRELEIAKQIPASMRVTGAYAMQRGLGLSESWLKDEVTKRKEEIGERYKIHQEDLAGPIKDLETSHDIRAKYDSELGSTRAISERTNERADEVAVRESVKLASALSDVTSKSKEYLKTLGKSDEELNKLIKSYEKGTGAIEAGRKQAESVRDIHAQGVRDILKTQGIQTQAEGRLTDAEIDAASKTEAGREQLRQYSKAQEEVSGLQRLEERAQDKGLMSKAGSAMRKIAGGFGLMYMRSMWNIISGAGGFGYEESVALNAGIEGAMAGAWGADLPGYNQQANLQAAKALYSGGGKRGLDVLQERMLRENPDLVNAGKALISGIGGFSASTWFLQSFGMGPAAVPIALGVGAATGIGSSLLTAYGNLTEETSYLASRYRNYSQYTAAEELANKNMGVLGFEGEVTYKDKEGARWNINPTLSESIMMSWEQQRKEWGAKGEDEVTQMVTERARIGTLANKAEEMVASGEASSNQEALDKMGVSEEDKFRLEKLFAYKFTTENMPGISQQGRVAAVSTWETAGGTVSNPDYRTLRGIGRAADLGVDLGAINQTFYTAIGAQFSEDRTGLLKTLSTAGVTSQDMQKLASLGKLGETMGVGWTQAAWGKTPEEVSDWLFESKKRVYRSDRGGFTYETNLTPKAEAMVAALSGPNADVVSTFMQAQELARRQGLTFEETAPGLLKESDVNIAVEDKDARLGILNRYITGSSALSQWAQKTGRSTNSLQRYWDNLYNTGTPQQMEQYLNLVQNPTPLNFGAYVSQMTPGAAAAWNGTMMDVMGTRIPQSALAFTGVNQGGPNAGKVSGRPWGQASIALPGMSAQNVAGQIWGNWQTAGGSAQGAVNAMVNGMTVGGQTYYGQQGMQAWQNQFSYNQAMAQIGVQLKGIALSEAFTTGKGLSAYGFAEGGGFWSIEDRQRELSRRQQEASFENQEWNMRQQEKRLALSEKYYGQNLALQQTQRTMQRSWTQQDWSYQQNVRDLQWGWKQEDFQENVRFMTGRDRRLAERQMKRDTIMHDMEGDQIERQKDRQQELWKLEDTRFSIDKKQHEESVKMQREEMAHDKAMFEQSKRFYAEEKKLQDESTRLQRAYYMEQNKLQRESAGIQAHAAKVQKDLNDAMLAYNDYADRQKGYLELATQSMQTLQTAIENLTKAMGGAIEPTTYTAAQTAHHIELMNKINLNVDGQRLANVTAKYIAE